VRKGVRGRLNEAVELALLVVEGQRVRVVRPVEGLKIRKNVTDLLLFELLLPALFHTLSLRLHAAPRGEDHILNQLSYALTIRVSEDLADYALEEGFVLEFDVFLELVTGFALSLVQTRVVVGVRRLGLGLCADETVQVGERRVELEGRVVFFQQLAHTLHTIICK
jgi:hypothetical protein